MLFALSHDDTYQFVKIHHYALGPHESMGRMELARLDYMLSSPLHTCVHCISRIMDSSSCYIHVHYGVHCEMYICINIRLIDLSLRCIICSQIKERLAFGCQTRTTDILSTERASVCRVFPSRQHPMAWESQGRGDFVKSALCGLYIYWRCTSYNNQHYCLQYLP